MYAPTEISGPVNISAVYQAKVPVPNAVDGVHLIVTTPLLSLVAVTFVGGEPVPPGVIGFMALGTPGPALLLAITST